MGSDQAGLQTISYDRLAAFAGAIMLALGAGAEDAEEVGKHLADANACGHDSHGVIRLTEYARDIRNGQIIPQNKATVAAQAGSVTILDAHRSLGIAAAALAVRTAIAAARADGLAAVALRHATHVGRLGYYAEAACAAGQVLIMTAGAIGPGVGVTMVPGTAVKFGGGNPWCFGFPAALTEPPVIVDISSSVTAEGKIRVARAERRQLAPGLIVDAQGQPSTSPDDFYHGGGLMPLGGPAQHKGVGLIVASGLLAALSMIGDPAPTLAGTPRSEIVDSRSCQARTTPSAVGGVFMLAIDPEAFGGSHSYRALISDCLTDLTAVTSTHGGTLTMPGEPEATARRHTISKGIRLPGALLRELAALATEAGVKPL